MTGAGSDSRDAAPPLATSDCCIIVEDCIIIIGVCIVVIGVCVIIIIIDGCRNVDGCVVAFIAETANGDDDADDDDAIVVVRSGISCDACSTDGARFYADIDTNMNRHKEKKDKNTGTHAIIKKHQR